MNSNHSNTEHLNRLMRLKEVIHTSSLSRASIYSFMEQGAFPQSVSLGARAIGWRSQDVQNWIQERDERLVIQAVEKAKQEKRYGR